MHYGIIIEHLFVGQPKAEENIKQKTAINKTSVNSIIITTHEIIEDHVANLEHHGGDNRVLHQYALENYDLLQAQYPDINFFPGSIGENLSARGMNEGNVCIGDIYQIGKVICVVTEPRKPCGTINQKYNIRGIAKHIQTNMITGWFYKIIEDGEIFVGDEITLLSRPYPQLTLKKCIGALLIKAESTILKLMVTNPVLSENWKEPANKVLETGQLEDDSLRLGSE